MTIETKTLPKQHYLYVKREVEMSSEAIGQAMGSGFGEVFEFVGSNEIAPLSMPMTLYTDMPDGPKMAFRVGVFVSSSDAAKATGPISAGTIDAGTAVTTTHIGAYARLNESHQAVWKYCDENNLTKAMPVWEIFVDDPTSLPEDEVKTQIYRAVQ